MLVDRLGKIDWMQIANSLTNRGFAPLPRVLTPAECGDLIALYADSERFRSRIEMAKFRFGRGEYQYFAYPLPPLVNELRNRIYPRLAPVANEWAELLSFDPFPADLPSLLEECHRKGQNRPTPLMLRYREGDYNALHQDVYGELTFPFQVVFFLSEPGRDYTGGEFLLVEQQPRAQSVGRSLLLRQGDGLIITTRRRPAQGKRGSYSVAVRHGVSEVTSGERWTLGVIFHDAQ